MASKTILKNIRIGKHVTGIASSCFAPCVNLNEVYIPSTVTTISESAFTGCSNLQKVQFTEQTSEQASAMHDLWNTGLRMPIAIDKNGNVIPIIEPIPSYTTIYYVGGSSMSMVVPGTLTSSLISNIDQVQSVYGGTDCTAISDSVFMCCSNLMTVSFPVCTTINDDVFGACRSLTTVNFPVCTTIGKQVFAYCESLTTASFPACTMIGTLAFTSCYRLTTVNFPACTTISASVFYMCHDLTTASFYACTMIDSYAFSSCARLISLYLTGSLVCSLAASNAFMTTPIAGRTEYTSGVLGSIFVPQSLVTEYQNATNWTYFSSRFVGI